MNIIDLTYTYVNGMKGPSKNHPTVEINRMGKHEVLGFNTSSMLLGSHIGTHMDAAYHFVPDGFTIENVNLKYCVGDVTIIDGRFLAPGSYLTVDHIKNLDFKERVLVRFGWGKYWETPEFRKDYPCVSVEAAKYMMEKGVKLLAVDTISPDPQPEGKGKDFPLHNELLREELIIVENLDIPDDLVLDREYELIALPLKVCGADGSPCRVILVEK